MSRSNWLLIAALVGLAVLYPIESPSYAQTGTEHANREPKQDAKPIDLSPIANEIKGLTRAIEAIKPEGKSSDEIEREKSDLQAQQDMARWARLMYVASALTTLDGYRCGSDRRDVVLHEEHSSRGRKSD
jgi:hypothetical protein